MNPSQDEHHNGWIFPDDPLTTNFTPIPPKPDEDTQSAPPRTRKPRDAYHQKDADDMIDAILREVGKSQKKEGWSKRTQGGSGKRKENQGNDNACPKPRGVGCGGKKKDDDGNEIVSNVCHQCERNDKGCVVRCSKCKTKRYCEPCMMRWYPNRTEQDFIEACPVCCFNCNCKGCLRLEVPKASKKRADVKFSRDEEVQYSQYIMRWILPFMKGLVEEQRIEKEIEAKIKGTFFL